MHPTSTSLSPAVQSLLLYLTSQLGGDTVRTVVQLPLLLIFLDLVTGVASAYKRHVFDAAHLSDFVGQDLVKYLVCFLMALVLSILFGPNSPYALIALIPLGSLGISVAGSIIANMKELFPGDTVLVGAVEHELSTALPGYTINASAAAAAAAAAGPPVSPPSSSPPAPSPDPYIAHTPPATNTASYAQLVQSLETGTNLPVVAAHPPQGDPPSTVNTNG